MVALVAVLLVLTGFVRAGPVAVDDLGREVELPAPAVRIVSLAPHLTEILFSLGVGDRVVGTSRFSDYPPAAQQIPVVGDAFGVNVETVIALDPDIVFAWSTGGVNRALSRLQDLGVVVYFNEAESIEGIGRTMVMMGVLVGREARGLELQREFEQEIDRIHRRWETGPVRSVFFQISGDALYTVNGTHLMGQAIELCHARNIFAAESVPVPMASEESVLSADPDIIVISRPKDAQSSGWEKKWSQYPGFSDKIRRIDPGLISHPSMRMLPGIEQLCAVIHGQGDA